MREIRQGGAGEMKPLYSEFGLVLTVTHDCNLRCAYCYAGAKTARTMPEDVGRKAIDRAVASVSSGGKLELSFFGGEATLEAGLILSLVEYARTSCGRKGVRLAPGLTTNGTVRDKSVWKLLTMPEMYVAVSHDGLPGVHDANRKTAGGRGSSSRVLSTIRALRGAGKDVDVVMAVGPESVAHLSGGVEFLLGEGVRRFVFSLNVWAEWARDAGRELTREVPRCGKIWRENLPEVGMSWFDEKLALMVGADMERTAACSFGNGEVAVAPSGNLYPCERMVGDDSQEGGRWAMGHVCDGDNFLGLLRAPCRRCEACDKCEIAPYCTTTCRCSNYVRTGDMRTPDGLLCLLNHLCFNEVAAVLDREGVCKEESTIKEGVYE